MSAQLGGEGVFQPGPLQQARQRRALPGSEIAQALFRRGSRGLQTTAQIVEERVTSRDSFLYAIEKKGTVLGPEFALRVSARTSGSNSFVFPTRGRIMLNLILNAIEAMISEDDARELIMSTERGSSEGLLIAVGDTGR